MFCCSLPLRYNAATKCCKVYVTKGGMLNETQRAKSRKIGAKYLTLLRRIIIISPIRDTVDLTVKLWSFHTPNLGVIPEFPHSPEFCFFVCHLRRYVMLPILGQGALLEQGT